MRQPEQLLPEREGESDDERRFREAMNRHGSQLLQTIDAVFGTRTADARVQRQRNIARNHITDGVLHAMLGFAIMQEEARSRRTDAA